MMNCSGGQMPWGAWVTCEETVNGPDVGPDFTGASEHPADQAARLRLRGADRGARRRQADHARPGASRTRRCRSTRARAGSTSPRTTSRSRRASTATRPKTNPMESGHLDNEGTLQMLAVKGQPNAHLEGHQRKGAVYSVEWVDIDDPDPTFPYTPGQTAPTANDTALQYVGDQGRALGAAGFSRLEGQIYDNGVVYFTSTQGGGDARDRQRAHQRLRQRLRPGLGLRHPLREAAPRLPVAGQADVRLPRQHHRERPRHARRLRGQHRRQLRARPQPWRPAAGTSPSTGAASAARAAALRRRVRRVDVQPRRPDALRQHPGQRGHVVRDLGPVGAHRRLTAPASVRQVSRGQRDMPSAPGRAWRVVLSRLGAPSRKPGGAVSVPGWTLGHGRPT